MERAAAGGVIGALTATVAWGAMFAVAASAMRAIDPFYMTAIRYATAGVIFLAILAIVEKPRALRPDGQGWRLFVYGSLGYAGFNFLAFFGQHALGVAGAIIVPVVVATAPLLTALVLWVWQRTRPAAVTFAAMVIALPGVVLVVTSGSIAGAVQAASHGGGVLMPIAGVFCFIVYSIGSTRFPGWSPLRYAALTCLFANATLWAVPLGGSALGLLPLPTLAVVTAHVPELLYLAAVAGVIGILGWNIGIARLGPQNAVLFGNLVPVVAMVVAAIQGHAPAAVQIAGTALTVGALVVNNLFQRAQRSSASVAQVTGRVGTAYSCEGVSSCERSLPSS